VPFGDGESFEVTIKNLSGEVIDPSLPTWIVIHGLVLTLEDGGLNGSVGDLATEILNERGDDGEQVLVLDWADAAHKPWFEAGIVEDRIEEMADWVFGTLRQHGFDGSSLNLVG